MDHQRERTLTLHLTEKSKTSIKVSLNSSPLIDFTFIERQTTDGLFFCVTLVVMKLQRFFFIVSQYERL
jgi:hypothetical protein